MSAPFHFGRRELPLKHGIRGDRAGDYFFSSLPTSDSVKEAPMYLK